MPATIVQSNSGGFNSTTGNATLPVGTTVGNWLLLIIGHGSSSTNLGPAPPTGFTSASGSIGDQANNNLGLPKTLFYRKATVAGETSWAIAQAVSGQVSWCTIEIQGLDLTTPKDVTPAAISFSTGTSISTGTTPISTTYDGIIIAGHTAFNATNATVPTWSGHTDGLVELTDAGVAGASTAVALSVSVLPVQTLGQFSCTATSSVSANLSSSMVVYTVAGAKRAANVINMAGAEQATVAGLTAGVSTNLQFDVVAGTPAVVASPRPGSGAYCYELSSTAAAENLVWNFNSIGAAGNVCVVRLSVYFPTALPGSNVDLLSYGTGASPPQGLMLAYRTASQKLAVAVSSGTYGSDALSATTVTANTWYDVDLCFDGSAATVVGLWRINGVDQTQATDSGGPFGTNSVTVGWTTATTATVRYDDIVVSKTRGHYPLGDFRIFPLRPDPAGTLTVSGTDTNFNTFTSNGTMAAWDATAALAAIDEAPPPTIGASADGLAQVAIAASDYVDIPMQTYSPAGTGAVRAVKMYACGWAAGSPAAATIGFRGFDGTNEVTLLAAADPGFTNSTTTPSWVAKMYKPTAGWTQARLDNLSFRVGFSTGATPNIGIHTVYAEVAISVASVKRIASVEASEFVVDAYVVEDSSAMVGFDITTPAGERSATFDYDLIGVPQTPVVVPPGATTSITVDAEDITVVTYAELTPDPNVDY